ncbi:pentapeptide repeat-containing protein [Actinosynnema sp. CS-041913]|uniref:pentapeptide repeat-containing protein n=1 Tax=Actinosynnema sp. CS-041913 TaxID=3239917 RepID=UPI003D8FC930
MSAVVWLSVSLAVVTLVVVWMLKDRSRRQSEIAKLSDPKDRIAAIDAGRTYSVGILGGVALLAALVPTGIGTHLSRQALEVSNDTLKVTQDTFNNSLKQQAIDRYAKAVENLGSESETTRVGALYSLRALLGDLDHHQAVVDLLAAFVRQHAKALAATTQASAPASCTDTPPFEPSLPVQVAMELLAKRDSRNEERRLDLRGAYLAGLKLDPGANFEGALLDEANFAYAQLWDVNLKVASLDHADLSYACLRNGEFRGSHTYYANFEHSLLDNAEAHTDFKCARMRGAQMSEAKLDGMIVRGAHMQDVNLDKADFRRGALDRVDVTGATFNGTHLEGADLEFTIGLVEGQLTAAHTDASTQMPMKIDVRPPVDCK